MSSSPLLPAHGLAAFPEWELVARTAGRRVLAIGLASGLRYARAPILEPGLVRATFAVPAREASPPGEVAGLIHVELRIERAGDPVSGECSRCSQVFGPCPHVTVLAIDLARSPALRSALAGSGDLAAACARAPALRAAIRAELDFDRALGAWLASSGEPEAVEIAAGAFEESDPARGRGYGEHVSRASSTVTIVVRRRGSRKLMAGRELVAPTGFAPSDRRVLEHAQDRGTGRKALYARGVEASLVLDAMREHGRVFTLGYKTRLDFRPELVRPTVSIGEHEAADGEGPLSALVGRWTTDDRTTFGFDEAAFFPGPFPYVWCRDGAIYRVAPDVDLDFARQLAASPVLVVPRGRLEDTGARLLRATRGRGVIVPVHEAFGLPPVETPAVVLRLRGEPLDVEGELVAVYRAREVALVGRRIAPQVHDARDVARDAACEERARARIASAGLIAHGRSEEREQSEGGEGTPPPDGATGRESGEEVDPDRRSREGAQVDERIAVHGEAAVVFWQTGLTALRDGGDPPVQVELSERLARVRVGAPVAARVHVALEGDWLDTRLEFASGELGVELGAVRAALARKQRWVALSDGSLARITGSIAALSSEAHDALRGASEARLPAHQLGRLDRWIEENDGRMDAAVAALRSRLRALAVATDPELPRGLRATLRPYQRLGLAWLQFLHALGAGGILADDMGLGKTVMTLAFLLWRKQRRPRGRASLPNLVVCPTSVAGNWMREAERFTPGLRVVLSHGRARNVETLEGHDLVVTTYALLRRDLDRLASTRFGCVVLDEAQNIKNADSLTTRAANRLDAGMRLALSGTPIENRLRELWSLSSFVNPGILGTSRAFEARFERPIAADRASPAAAELRSIVRPFLLRRTKSEVLRDLPPKVEIDRAVTLTESDKRMYDALAHTLRASIAKDIAKRGLAQSSISVFAALTRLRQMACDPRLVDPALARASAPSAKREAFLELVRELVAEGRRALVFSQFVELLTLWRRDLDDEAIAYEYLDGSTTKRDDVVARFQDGSSPLFLISLKAGGAGLNLTAADTVIHCDPWWNPAVEDQATDRAHRIGQDKSVTVVRLLARGTIEEKILSLKSKKRALVQAVIGDEGRALEGLTADDVDVLLGGVAVDADGRGPSPDDAPPPSAAIADAPPIASARRVLDPEFDRLVALARQWLSMTGASEAKLASWTGIPTEFAARLARGEPFPCSRAVAERIRRRMREY